MIPQAIIPNSRIDRMVLSIAEVPMNTGRNQAESAESVADLSYKMNGHFAAILWRRATRPPA